MIDLKELREATENITSGKALFRYANVEKLKTNFTMATNPNVILELLDRLEAAEKVCDAQEKWRKSETFQEYDLAQNECALALKAWQEVNKCADQQQKK